MLMKISRAINYITSTHYCTIQSYHQHKKVFELQSLHCYIIFQ